MFIETETTPNPLTLKFLPGRMVMEKGSADFASPEAAESSPLAAALFSLGDVSGVFFGTDFISVTRGEGGAEWQTLKAEVLGILVDHFTSGAPLFTVDAAQTQAVFDAVDADIVEQIEALLEDRVRPAVANDGGDIVFRGFEKGVVYLHMQGACAGCPSSTATLKNGIEQLLRHYVPEVVEVRAV